MKDLIKKFDFQGFKANFTFDQKNNHSSVIGGIITILIIFVFIVIFILFGHDFYYKLNPRSLSRLIDLGTYDKFKVNNSNFTIAFRLEDI